MSDFNIIINGATLSALAAVAGVLIKLLRDNRESKAESDSIKLEILTAVDAVRDKLSEQNGDIKVIKSELLSYKERCEMHLKNQTVINEILENRLTKAEEKIFALK